MMQRSLRDKRIALHWAPPVELIKTGGFGFFFRPSFLLVFFASGFFFVRFLLLRLGTDGYRRPSGFFSADFFSFSMSTFFSFSRSGRCAMFAPGGSKYTRPSMSVFCTTAGKAPQRIVIVNHQVGVPCRRQSILRACSMPKLHRGGFSVTNFKRFFMRQGRRTSMLFAAS